MDEEGVYYNTADMGQLGVIPLNKIMEVKDIKRIYQHIKPILNQCLLDLKDEETKEGWYVSIELQMMTQGYKFPRHVDSPRKLLSMVLYVDPPEEHGTTLHDSEQGELSIELEWKPNRVLVFMREEGVTWHSNETHSIERVGMNINIFRNSTDFRGDKISD